jgi:pantetheine-phosphate adenylyltransferase
MEQKIAIYPGSFDPLTNGHLDIITRGLRLFDKLIVTIFHNPAKHSSLFTPEERKDIISEVLKEYPNVEVDCHAGLLVDYAEEKGAYAILRGLRAVSDFEYEFQMNLMNRRLKREIQTVFLMTGLKWIFTSSSIVKEAAQFGGNIESMVPPIVDQKMREKYAGFHKKIGVAP